MVNIDILFEFPADARQLNISHFSAELLLFLWVSGG